MHFCHLTPFCLARTTAAYTRCFYGFRWPGRAYKAPDQVRSTLAAPRSHFSPVRAFVPQRLSLLDCSANLAHGMFAAILRWPVPSGN